MIRRHLHRVSLSTALVLAGGLGVAAFMSRESWPDARSLTTRPVEVAEGGYVSSGTCKACHPSQYESWHGSFHRTMTQIAAPEIELHLVAVE